MQKLDAGVPGLTGRWQLEEAAGQTAQDSSGSGATLFIENADWTIGRIGAGSLHFNGGVGTAGSRCWVSNDDYRVLPEAGRPFTVSLWFSPDALTTGAWGLAGSDANGSNGWHVALSTTGSGTNFLVFAATGSGASLNVTGRTLLLPHQWYHLTVTHDGSLGSIYLDGIQLASGTGSVPMHNGAVYFGGGLGRYDSFLGRIDDVRIFTNSLSAEQISLAGEWRFDEGGGTFSSDSSGLEHHASLTDSVVRVPGRSGGGADLSSGQVIIPNDDLAVLPPSGAPFRVSLWLRANTLAAGRFGLVNCGLAGIEGWQMDLAIEEGGPTLLNLGSRNWGGTLDLSVPIDLIAGTWGKLDMTFNGAIATVYWNGRKVRAGIGAIRASRKPLIVGAAPGLAGFPGVIDELKIYHGERGESEIGPVAPVMWETAFINTVTNIPLRGSGPAGKRLTYAIVPMITPTNGAVVIAPGSSTATYSAGARRGPDAFAYTVTDGEFTSAPAIVTVSLVEPHWLSPTGGSAGPRDGRSPATAWAAATADAVDAIWRTNNFYDCFFYAPGGYQTRGWKYYERSTANPGCKHIGSGSDGPNKTTIKLVDIWEAWAEEAIFGAFTGHNTVDGFEVHRMVLDCNADNLPKYGVGEPVWIRIPLASSGRVDTVTLRWADRMVSGGVASLAIGRASVLDVCSLRSTGSIFSTNCLALTNSTQLTSVNLGAEADELLLRLNRRDKGVGLYGLSEIEISGVAASLPLATNPGAGNESRLGSGYSIVMAVDGDPGTAWASGAEAESRIELPLAPGTTISQVNLQWSCRYVPSVGQLGPAGGFTIRAREESSGSYVDVPSVRHNRAAAGREIVTFGTTQSTNPVVTDRLVILLTNREPGVDYYSVEEITLQNGPIPVGFRVPTSKNRFGNISILRAFDHDSGTEWVSGTQGAVSAIIASGNNLKFTDLKVIGFGTKIGREGFPMYLTPPTTGPGGHFGNVLVESCVFEQPGTNNSDGLTLISMGHNPTSTLTNAVIRRCTVSGGLNKYFYPLKAMSATQVEECTIRDCDMAIYFEPDLSILDVQGSALVRSNQFINVGSGVYLLTHPGAYYDSITCLNNEMILNGRLGWGFAICDTCTVGKTGTCTNVVVLNNIIRYSDWLPRPNAGDGGLYYSDLQHAVFGNNVVALGTGNSMRVRGCPSGLIPPSMGDCEQFVTFPPDPTYPPCLDTLPAGYRRAWFNNRDLSGNLMPVRFSSNGAEGLSSQQQWPE